MIRGGEHPGLVSHDVTLGGQGVLCAADSPRLQEGPTARWLCLHVHIAASRVEFPAGALAHLLLPSLWLSIWLPPRRADGNDNDELRINYVAMTRAARRLSICWPLQVVVPSQVGSEKKVARGCCAWPVPGVHGAKVRKDCECLGVTLLSLLAGQAGPQAG